MYNVKAGLRRTIMAAITVVVACGVCALLGAEVTTELAYKMLFPAAVVQFFSKDELD